MRLTLLIGFLFFSVIKGPAFSLLGKFEDWMQPSNGLDRANMDGGFADLNQEYRWNVPVVTYGFDESFTSHFGKGAEAAVNEAVGIINALPPASDLLLENFSYYPARQAEFQAIAPLFDLKSVALSRLLHNLGLAPPESGLFLLKQWHPVLLQSIYDWTPEAWACLAQRNYDPQALASSQYINDVLYSPEVYMYAPPAQVMFAMAFKLDPIAPWASAVADCSADKSPGLYYSGLSRDDAGGLLYLYHRTNINYETLLPGVSLAEPITGQLVDGAWRPGVEKVSLAAHPIHVPSGAWLPWTNTYEDIYLEDGVIHSQRVTRVTSSPDIVFTVSDLRCGSYTVKTAINGTSEWRSHAFENLRTNGVGPGIIIPPGRITIGRLATTAYGYFTPPFAKYEHWVHFAANGTSNHIYPRPSTTQSIEVYPEFHGPPIVAIQDPHESGAVALQTSTNLLSWTTSMEITNTGSPIIWHPSDHKPMEFFRVVPVPEDVNQ